MIGTWWAMAWRTSSRTAGLWDATKPSRVTRTNSSGNRETNPEWARLATSTPPLSSPYFLMSPTTNAGTLCRCCMASTRRIALSIGFIATTTCPASADIPPARQHQPQTPTTRCCPAAVAGTGTRPCRLDTTVRGTAAPRYAVPLLPSGKRSGCWAYRTAVADRPRSLRAPQIAFTLAAWRWPGRVLLRPSSTARKISPIPVSHDLGRVAAPELQHQTSELLARQCRGGEHGRVGAGSSAERQEP